MRKLLTQIFLAKIMSEAERLPISKVEDVAQTSKHWNLHQWRKLHKGLNVK